MHMYTCMYSFLFIPFYFCILLISSHTCTMCNISIHNLSSYPLLSYMYMLQDHADWFKKIEQKAYLEHTTVFEPIDSTIRRNDDS